MAPDEALRALAKVVRSLLAQVDEETRLDFVRQFVGDSGADKVSSLVHL
jgi:hypothetical protein